MSLETERHCLIVEGHQPGTAEDFVLCLRREVSTARTGARTVLALDLARMPWREQMRYTWSTLVDPDLDLLSQVYGFVQKAIMDLDRTILFWGSRIVDVQALASAVPRWSVGWMLFKELVDARGEAHRALRAPIGQDEPPGYDHVLAELIGVDGFYVRCGPQVVQDLARLGGA